MGTTSTTRWRDALAVFLDRRVLILLFLGFSAGIPILLIFSSLSLWLGEAGVARSAVTFFSWAALGYSFKFVWAPLIDEVPLPYLTKKLGRRRAWLLIAQLLIVTAIVCMAMVDPAQGGLSLTLMAMSAVLLGFSSATQDIVIDAFRIEVGEVNLQAAMAASYTAGYRIGMIVAGAGALFLASGLGTEKGNYIYEAWQFTYLAMAAMMLVGILTTLLIKEPPRKYAPRPWAGTDYGRLVLVFIAAVIGFVLMFIQVGQWLPSVEDAFLGFLVQCVRMLSAISMAGLLGYWLVRLGAVNRAMAHQVWIEPVKDFFVRYGLKTAFVLLALIGLYRISDIVAGVISNVFYQDMDFTKEQIATAVKTFGMAMVILGGFLGGLLTQRYSVMTILVAGVLLVSFTNLAFIGIVYADPVALVQLPWLADPVLLKTVWMYFAVTVDNLAAGLASAAFIAFLSSLTSVSFTAVQYAIFSSLMTLIPKVIGGYSGTIVDSIGYPAFFAMTAALGAPVLVLIYWARYRLGLLEPVTVSLDKKSTEE